MLHVCYHLHFSAIVASVNLPLVMSQGVVTRLL